MQPRPEKSAIPRRSGMDQSVSDRRFARGFAPLTEIEVNRFKRLSIQVIPSANFGLATCRCLPPSDARLTPLTLHHTRQLKRCQPSTSTAQRRAATAARSPAAWKVRCGTPRRPGTECGRRGRNPRGQQGNACLVRLANQPPLLLLQMTYPVKIGFRDPPPERQEYRYDLCWRYDTRS
jgi:hypothetical protein